MIGWILCDVNMMAQYGWFPAPHNKCFLRQGSHKFWEAAFWETPKHQLLKTTLRWQCQLTRATRAQAEAGFSSSICCSRRAKAYCFSNGEGPAWSHCAWRTADVGHVPMHTSTHMQILRFAMNSKKQEYLKSMQFWFLKYFSWTRQNSKLKSWESLPWFALWPWPWVFPCYRPCTGFVLSWGLRPNQCSNNSAQPKEERLPS